MTFSQLPCLCAVLWDAAHVFLIPFSLLENKSSLKSYVLCFAAPPFSSDVYIANLPLSYMLLAVHGLAATRRNCCPGPFRLLIWELSAFEWTLVGISQRSFISVEHSARWIIWSPLWNAGRVGWMEIAIWRYECVDQQSSQRRNPWYRWRFAPPLCMLH